MTPFLSIISVTRNDAWSLTKTMRSVFAQSFKDFEYVVVDGASTDGTSGLIEFWQAQGLISCAVSESDSGVYQAMNKGLRLAQGQYVCFLNAGDVFAADDVLQRVHAVLTSSPLDGLLGWGELNGQVWASWAEHEAFKLASLGFCHQSLYVKRALLLNHPFDERPFKTDSDTLQLGRLYAAGARIAVVPEVLAVRGIEPGISADLPRTQVSIVNTLVEEYAPLGVETAERIVAFRRRCEMPQEMLALLEHSPQPMRSHLAYMVLDTLFLRQSAGLDPALADRLFCSARDCIAENESPGADDAVDRLLHAQARRQELMEAHAAAARSLSAQVSTFQAQEQARLARPRTPAPDAARSDAVDFIVSLTSFPGRIATLHFVIRSLIEQTCRPSEIHLWLGSDEFPSKKWLPRALLDLEQHGLRIRFARRTFHQYDKFAHSSDLNRQMPFVIVDDDVIYPFDSMSNLLSVHRAHPQAVIANRCHLMGVLADGSVGPYREWQREVQFSRPSLRAFPTGAGGVLYPTGFLSAPVVTEVRDILAHAPYADDLWLKACAMARGIPSMSTPLSRGADWYLRYTPTMKAGALHSTNVDLGLNDLQIRRCLDWLSQVRPAWRQELLADPAS